MVSPRRDFDCLVIGGGHAGVEAAWAAASALGPDGRVALITMDPSRIGAMSCNPAIGGLAKGQMVREIDALGGLMGRAADASGILFKVLNASKGPAVRGPRAQCDKYAYMEEIQRLINTRAPGSSAEAGAGTIAVLTGVVDDLLVEAGVVVGVVLGGARMGEVLRAGAVVLTTGTFMRALMHTGTERSIGGRVGEASAIGISAALRRLGFELGRLKTGTPPRLARESIDWDVLPRQLGDSPPTPFSELTDEGGRFPALPQVECRLTQTTAAAHELIRANLDRAPMYSGQIDAECGPRYCPSIEDKVVRFADRDSHHVFLEPESLRTNEIYCNGISTSLPCDVQVALVRSMPGCSRARIQRWGYAVEYDMVWPSEIDSTCAAKRLSGLFLAGQINGTSGYEEAAGQGLVAGLNAARFVRRAAPVRLGRDQAYIGVMLDDLVTRTPREPYRMFTSRAEHRLLLRSDNSAERLTPLAREWGLVDGTRWANWQRQAEAVNALRGEFSMETADGRARRDLALRPEATLEVIAARCAVEAPIAASAHWRRCLERVVTELRYEGYLRRAQAEVRRSAELESATIPEWLEPSSITGLRREAIDALRRYSPRTIGQAGRLAGVHPADVAVISIAVRRQRAARGSAAKAPTDVA